MLPFPLSDAPRSTWLLLLGFAAACGGSQAAPTSEVASPSEAPASEAPETDGSDTGTADAEAPDSDAKAFHDMKQGERIAFMKNVVMPHMSEVFQSVNAERYGSMNCATCHGAGAKAGHFHMPSPDLPPLDATDGFAAHRAAAPEVTAFMMEKVVPEMARLLGESPYDPETGRGFGCFDCHEKK